MLLAGYRFTELIHDAAKTRVYRGVREADERAVTIKVGKADYPTERELAQYELAYSIGRLLSCDGIIEHLALERHGAGLALVTEDYGARSLDLLLKTEELDLETKLRIAVQLALALGNAHQHEVIHKDIKPHNIVVNLETGVVKLIDFGISCQLDKENPSLVSPRLLEGTLAYVSPEQTGRMNRSLDYRTDLYSAGITLDELFTGRLPFDATDPMELIHCHLAQRAPLLHEVDDRLPPILSDIVSRLLEKTAEERYQSAHGLRHDLEHCLELLRSTGRVEAFPLGQRDRSTRFALPQKLYGREAETAQLLAAFARASEGKRQLLLVSGYSGIGKSALVNELQKPIVEHRGYFCAGKFDQFRRDLPYRALIDALRDLLRQVLTESSERLEELRHALQEALGSNGRVIADVVPELERILGPQPEVPELGPTESQNRFSRVFRTFIRAFARPGRPLTIFLDDLQWADLPSLQLMEVLITDPRSEGLFLVGAYRDNEVGPTHPLVESLRRLEQEGQSVERLSLSPLDAETLGHLTADALGCSLTEARGLADLIHRKTQGNPFFVGEFLRTLYQEGLVRLDENAGRWRWSLAELEKLSITENVVELLSRKLRSLPEATLQVLQLAACAGNRFDLKTLALVGDRSRRQAARDLQRALTEGFVVPTDGSYKYLAAPSSRRGDPGAEDDELGDAGYRFQHDRVHQAAYSLLEEDERQELHLRFGRLLRDRVGEGGDDELLMDVANHFKMAGELVSEPGERRAVAELQLAAGRRAKASMAFDPAASYLREGLRMLSATAWEDDHELALGLHVEAAEAELLSKRYPEMDELVDTVLANARGVFEQVKVRTIRMQAKIARAQHQEACAHAIETLALLGVKLPRKAKKIHILVGLLRTVLAVGRREPEALAELPALEDPRVSAAMDVLMRTTAPALQGVPELFPLVIFEIVRLSLRHGNSPTSAWGYLVYGHINCGVLGRIDLGYRYAQLGFQVAEKYRAAQIASKMTMCFNSYVRHWKEHCKQSLAPLTEGWRNGLELGDHEFAAYNALWSFDLAFLSGRELGGLLDRYEEHVQWVHESSQDQACLLLDPYVQAAQNLSRREPVETRLRGELFDIDVELPRARERGTVMVLNFASMADLVLAFLYGDLDRAERDLELAAKHMDTAMGSYLVPLHAFYESLVLCARAAEERGLRRWKRLWRVAWNQRKLRSWARSCPPNHEHKYQLVEAERLRAKGRIGASLRCYQAAIEGAREHGFLNEEALANELLSRLYRERKLPELSHFYLGRAHQLYRLWGAWAKVAKLEAEHPGLRDSDRTEPRHSGTISVTSSSSTGGAELDLHSVMEASQVISGEIVLASLLRKVMRIVIQTAGARRGCLILERDGSLFVEAEGHADAEAVEVLRSLPLAQASNVARSIVNYVARTREQVVLNDATQEGMFRQDPRVASAGLRSVLCIPLVHQGKLTAILYLENEIAAGAFTPHRIELLELLSSQVATSVQNARLYASLEEYSQTLEERVEQRTQALEHASKEAEDAKATAEQANQAKSSFLANMSHELRTPLNAIIGYSQMIAEEMEDLGQADFIPDLKKIDGAGRHLLELINGVLDLSKVEAGKMELYLEDFELEALVTDIGDIIKLLAAERGNELRITRHGELGTMRADQTKVRQSLFNLLSNACKFTQDGVIELEAARSHEDGQDWISLRVSDQGIGMSPEQLDRIFQPFTQAERGTARRFGGTGLGLTITRRFCEMMGGRIDVESQEGAGTTFTIRLPAAVEAEARSD